MAGAAMALGLASYYIAGARTAQSYAQGDTAGAEKLAEDTGMLGEDVVDFSPGAALDAEAVAAMTGTAGSTDAPADAATEDSSPQTTSTLGRFKKRFSSSLKKAQDRARPVIEKRGTGGMFLLCFAPSPMGTAAAFLGGLMRFGFARYLAASFAAKYLLAGVIVALALILNDAARTV